MKRPLSALIYGEAGSGKSTLAASAPGRKLFIDAESSTHHAHKRVDGEIVIPDVAEWKIGEEIPDAEVVFITLTSYTQLQPVYDFLAQHEHPFESIVVDSVTQLQQRMIEHTNKSNNRDALRENDWGVIRSSLAKFVRDIRDLGKDERSPVVVTVFLTDAVEKQGKLRPNIQGGAAHDLPSLVDLVGAVKMVEEDELNSDGDEVSVAHQKLLRVSTDEYLAKTRSPIIARDWPPVLTDPVLSELYQSTIEGS